jgi:hypothetical protein
VYDLRSAEVLLHVLGLAMRQGAFFNDGLDVNGVQLPGVSPLSSHTGRLPLDFFGTELQIAEEDHVVASCSSSFLVFARNCVAL